MNRLKGQNKTYLQWVDNTKLLACALVVLGHFAQSMVRAGILPVTAAYTLCNSALYTFHVPLFFICSAYLYRRFTVLRTCRDYARHVGKKALALGVKLLKVLKANQEIFFKIKPGRNGGIQLASVKSLLLSIIKVKKEEKESYIKALSEFFDLEHTFIQETLNKLAERPKTDTQLDLFSYDTG